MCFNCLNKLFFYDKLGRWTVIFKMSELKHSVFMIRQDCQKMLLNNLIVLLNYLIKLSENFYSKLLNISGMDDLF